VVLASLGGQSTLLAVDRFAGDGQVEEAMSQPIIDFSNQAIPCLIKLRFIAVSHCHVVYCLALQVVDQCLEVLDGRRVRQRAHATLVVEESQRDRLAIGAVLELEYRARAVPPDAGESEAVAAQIAGKVEIRRLEDIDRLDPCLLQPTLYPL